MLSLTFAVGTNNTGLTRGLAEARTKVAEFGRAVGGSLLGFLGGFATLEGLKTMAEHFVRLKRISQSSGGVSTDFLQDVQLNAEKAGVDLDLVAKGVRKLVNEIDAAGGPSKKAAEALTAIGLSAEKVKGLSAEKLFVTVGTAIGGMENEEAKLVATTDLFGARLAGLAPIFDDFNENGLANTVKLSKDGIDSIVQFDDSLTQLTANLKGVFAPVLAFTAKGLNLIIALLNGVGAELGDLVYFLLANAGGMAAILEGLFTLNPSKIASGAEAIRASYKNSFDHLKEDAEATALAIEKALGPELFKSLFGYNIAGSKGVAGKAPSIDQSGGLDLTSSAAARGAATTIAVSSLRHIGGGGRAVGPDGRVLENIAQKQLDRLISIDRTIAKAPTSLLLR